jgi:hypothetical protein
MLLSIYLKRPHIGDIIGGGVVRAPVAEGPVALTPARHMRSAVHV